MNVHRTGKVHKEVKVVMVTVWEGSGGTLLSLRFCRRLQLIVSVVVSAVLTIGVVLHVFQVLQSREQGLEIQQSPIYSVPQMVYSLNINCQHKPLNDIKGTL